MIVAQTLYSIQPLDVPEKYVNMIPHCESTWQCDDPVPGTYCDYTYSVLDDFASLLSEEKYSVEDFAVWVDGILSKCFKKVRMQTNERSCKRVKLTMYG